MIVRGQELRVHAAGVASITPFDHTGALDIEGLRRHLRRLGNAGLTVYLAGSGSGEGNTLSLDETRLIFQTGVEELKGQVSVRAMGIEPRTAAQLLQICMVAEEVGLDAIHVYPPDAGHGVRPMDAELETYYIDVLMNTSLPVILASHFSAGYMLPIGLVERLVDRFDQVIGILATTPDVAYMVALIDRVGRRVRVHTGRLEQALALMSLGAMGFGSSEANIAPRLVANVLHEYRRGDLRAATESMAILLQLHAANLPFGSVRGVKAALEILGRPGGPPRRPRLTISDLGREELAVKLQQLDIRRIEDSDAKDTVRP